MKRRLFFKILLAFWLTFLLITQGVWLLFQLKRDDRPPPESMMAEAVAPVALGAAEKLIAVSGPEGVAAFRSSLPESQADRLSVAPVGSAAENVDAANAISRVVRGPDGRAYRLSYRYQARNPRPSLLNTPPELLSLGLLGGLLFSAILAWYLTAPINRLRSGFERLANGDLEVRLSSSIGQRRDEIADLGRDFDRMARRLEQLVHARDRLLHHVSHELRSPLARLQLAIALGRQSPDKMSMMMERIEQEAARLDALVGELLTLARAESGHLVGEDYFDLVDVVASVVEDAQFEAQSQAVRIDLIECVAPEDEREPLRGDAELIRRAIDNVVRNALRFSPGGSTIRITLEADSHSACYRVYVEDQGPGIDESALETIFDPFVRTGDGGYGLGLAIANRAIAAHGGILTARNREDGGLAVEILLNSAIGMEQDQ